MPDIKIYLCVTDGCNLACKGCYKYTTRDKVDLPKFLDLNKAKQYLDNIIKLYPEDNIYCTFHGGEPFYTGDISKYIDLINNYSNIKNMYWSATTNLIYNISTEHIKLFGLFKDKFFKTSWDVEDYRFRNISQKELWENNIKYLLSLGFLIQPIITVNLQTIQYSPSDLFEYFKHLGISTVNFERITETGRASIIKVKPTNRQVDEWLWQVYIINKSKYNFYIPLFAELEYAKTNGFVGCRKRECMQTVRTINTDGSVGACPNCADIYIIDKTGQYNTDTEKDLILKEKTVTDTCMFCKYYDICNGDCCQLSFDETGCPGLIKIYQELNQ